MKAWCGHCKKLAPEYAKAAKALKAMDPPVPLGKVDATVEKDLGTKFGIQGFPTLKWFVNGEAQEYEGGRTETEIINWIKKKTGPSAYELASVEAVEKFKTDNQVAVVFFGAADSKEFETYMSVTKTMDDVMFGFSHDGAVATNFKAEGNSIILFKSFDEGQNNFAASTDAAAVKAFINENRYKLISEFDDASITRIFHQNNAGLVLFTDSSDASNKALEALNSVGSQLKGKLVLTTSQTKDGLGKRLAEYIGVTDANVPTLRIITSNDDGLKKFAFEGEITGDSILKFQQDFASGALNPALKSEPVPEKNDEPVKVIVGKTFDEIVYDETKDVLVEFYAPWCGHCKSLAPIYEELAKKVAHNTNIVIAKMDSTANESADVNIKGFPTLKWFPKGSKKNPVDYDGERTVDGFISFLKSKTSFPWVEEGEKKAEL